MEKVCDDFPVYNKPVDYDCLIGDRYYVEGTAFIGSGKAYTVYDNRFNKIGYYELPKFSDMDASANAWILDGGNIFVQYVRRLPDDAKKYDYVMYSSSRAQKMKLHTLVVDPITGKEKTIKTSYVFEEIFVRSIDDEEYFNAYNDSVKNIASGSKIVNGAIDEGNFHFVSIGDDGRVGDSLKVDESHLSFVMTVDGKYYLALTKDLSAIVYDAKLNELAKVGIEMLGSSADFSTYGMYYYHNETGVLYDITMKEIYRSKKKDDGTFGDTFYKIDMGGSTESDFITLSTEVDESTVRLSVIRNGVKKDLVTYANAGEGAKTMPQDLRFMKGIFFTLQDADDKCTLYNANGVVIATTEQPIADVYCSDYGYAIYKCGDAVYMLK